jgi:hypothetical protein
VGRGDNTHEREEHKIPQISNFINNKESRPQTEITIQQNRLSQIVIKKPHTIKHINGVFTSDYRTK